MGRGEAANVVAQGPIKAGAADATDVEAAFAVFKSIPIDIDRYIHLRDLRTANSDLYFKLLLAHTMDIMPFIYTPTVGEACQRYHELPLHTHGLYLTPADLGGGVLAKLKAWPQQNIKVIVVTDGERILGLGDLGANGMGISEGKGTLYTTAAGVDPTTILPACIDVGTETAKIRDAPGYKGLRQPRVRGEMYDKLVDEFMQALKVWRPHVVLQFEDFGNQNAFRLLDTYRPQLCCFNDDVQGTAAVCLAAVLSALKGIGRPLAHQKLLFLGAGEAGIGIGQLISQAMVKQSKMMGLGVNSLEEAQQHCFFFDTKGLVCKSRTDLQHHKLAFAHDVPFVSDLHEAVKTIKPSILIGVSTLGSAFDEEIIHAMSEYNEHPIVMPLSNPTSKAEVTYEHAYEWSDGHVIFASGSPFPRLVSKDGHVHDPAQANNAYIFPAVGHACSLTNCTQITDEIFMVAAETLASISSKQDALDGRLFPSLSDIRAVSAKIMGAVGRFIVAEGLGTRPADLVDDDWESHAEAHMWGGAPAFRLPAVKYFDQIDAANLQAGIAACKV